jgi:hypothetical protein
VADDEAGGLDVILPLVMLAMSALPWGGLGPGDTGHDEVPRSAVILQLIMLVIGALLLALAVRRLRQYRLKERYVLLFAVTGLPFLGLAVWPGALAWVGNQIGVEYGTVALLVVTVFLMLMVFELVTIVSVQDRKIATLAQIVGIMMHKTGVDDRPDATVDPANRPAEPPL